MMAAMGMIHTPDNNADDEDTPLDAAPDMTITKVDDVADTTAPGATIIYTLTYDNVGNQDATGVVVTETVPAQYYLHDYRKFSGLDMYS